MEKTKNFYSQNECVANPELFVLNVTCTQIRKNIESGKRQITYMECQKNKIKHQKYYKIRKGEDD